MASGSWATLGKTWILRGIWRNAPRAVKPRKILGKPANFRKSGGIPLGLEILGKTRENLENLGTLRVPLGLEIVGKTREILENLGTLRIPLGLEILGKTREILESLGTLAVPLGMGILGKLGRTREN